MPEREPPCPLRDRDYGGLPGGGGYRSHREFEIGAQRICEATHCILGSLGKNVRKGTDWTFMVYSERGHLNEELGIIKKCVKEYSRTVYTDMVNEPLKHVRPEFEKRVMEAVESCIDDMLENSPKLIKICNARLRDLEEQEDIPDDVFDAAEITYYLTLEMAWAMKRSAEAWIDSGYANNPYQVKSLRNLVEELEEKLDVLFERIPEDYAPFA
jgi:hypothetical protein